MTDFAPRYPWHPTESDYRKDIMTPLSDEQIHNLWNYCNANPHLTERSVETCKDLISTVLYWQAMGEKAEFWREHSISYCKVVNIQGITWAGPNHPDSWKPCADPRHSWTDAQWIKATTKRVLGEG